MVGGERGFAVGLSTVCKGRGEGKYMRFKHMCDLRHNLLNMKRGGKDKTNRQAAMSFLSVAVNAVRHGEVQPSRP